MKASAENRDLVCYWPKTRLCNGLFSGCFDPIEGIEFVYEEPGLGKQIDYEGEKPVGELDIYGLKPKAELMSRIQNNITFLNDYDAVHVRRTDFDALANEKKTFVPDSEFFNFIDEADGKTPVFLATDNMTTQFAFAQKYKGLIRINRALKNTSTLRNSSLEDAVVDLFVCAAAKYFMGTKGSAFTEFIELLRSPNSPYSYESLTVKCMVIPDILPIPVIAEVKVVEEVKEEAVEEATQEAVEEVLEEAVAEAVVEEVKEEAVAEAKEEAVEEAVEEVKEEAVEEATQEAAVNELIQEVKSVAAPSTQKKSKKNK